MQPKSKHLHLVAPTGPCGVFSDMGPRFWSIRWQLGRPSVTGEHAHHKYSFRRPATLLSWLFEYPIYCASDASKRTYSRNQSHRWPRILTEKLHAILQRRAQYPTNTIEVRAALTNDSS